MLGSLGIARFGSDRAGILFQLLKTGCKIGPLSEAGGMLGTSLLAALIFRTERVVDMGNPVGLVKELTGVKKRWFKRLKLQSQALSLCGLGRVVSPPHPRYPLAQRRVNPLLKVLELQRASCGFSRIKQRQGKVVSGFVGKCVLETCFVPAAVIAKPKNYELRL